MAEPAYWIAGGALLVSTVALIFGFLRKPAFVSAATAMDLKDEINKLERRIENLERDNGVLLQRNGSLEQQINALRGTVEWWQSVYRNLKEETDRELRAARLPRT